MSKTFFSLVNELEVLLDKLNSILTGASDETVDVNGVTKDSISKAIKDNFSALQAMVNGHLAYATKAEMDAAGSPLTGELAEVWNDSVPSKNGLYGWAGTQWVKSPYDLTGLLSTLNNNIIRGLIVTEGKGIELSVNGFDITIGIPDGWRMLRNGSHIDLPSFNGILSNLDALLFDFESNTFTVQKLNSIITAEKNIVLYSVSGKLYSAHPDVSSIVTTHYKISDVTFEPEKAPTLNWDGNSVIININTGSRVITGGNYKNLPAPSSNTIPNLHGLFYDLALEKLSVIPFSQQRPANQHLIVSNINGYITSPFPALNKAVSNTSVNEIAFISDSLEIEIENTGVSNEKKITFNYGCRLVGGVNKKNYFDIPTTPYFLVDQSLLVVDKVTGIISNIPLQPTALENRFSILVTNINGHLSSPHPRLDKSLRNQRNENNSPELGMVFTDSEPLRFVSFDEDRAVTFTIPIFRYVDSTGIYLIQQQTVTMPQFTALFLDLNTLKLISGEAHDAYIRDTKKVQLAFNVNKFISSPIPQFQSQLNENINGLGSNVIGYKLNEITVGKDVGDNYKSLTEAFADITDNATMNRYKILLKPGVYNEVGPYGNGLEWKPYIYVFGAGQNHCKITGPQSPQGSLTFDYDTIHKLETGLLSGVTIEAYKSKYCIHADNGSDNYDFVLQNSITRHLGSEHSSNVYWDIGIGFRNAQNLTCINVEMQGFGLRMHGPTSSSYRIPKGLKGWGLTLSGCKLHRLDLEDFLEYYKSEVKLTGNAINEVELWVDPSWYNANPDVASMNRGWINNGFDINFRGNYIGRVLHRDSQTTTLLGGKTLIPGLNKRCFNAGLAIEKGQAVCSQPNIAKVISNKFEQTHDRISEWLGFGILVGWAEEDIEAGELGLVQYTGQPLAKCEAPAGSVHYGDPLELNENGSLIPHIDGDIAAYSLSDLTAENGLIRISIVKPVLL